VKSYAAHLADCRTLLRPRPAVLIPVSASLGSALARDVVAQTELPPFASSAMDGYAVRVSDVPGVLRIVGEVAAGQVPRAGVGAGTAVRIMTGSALPDGTEAIVPVEQAEEHGKVLEVRAATVPGRHLRPAGDDVRRGDLVLREGQLVGAAQLAALLATGETTVLVRPPWRVAVFSTGDELAGFPGRRRSSTPTAPPWPRPRPSPAPRSYTSGACPTTRCSWLRRWTHCRPVT
jgi:molybdopterin molybdotransferase